jgi:hypothetical protein
MWGMQLVGITGGIGHGKSTLAVDLAACAPKSKHFESSGIIIEVINAWRSARPLFPTDSSIEQINHWLQSLPAALKSVVHTAASQADLRLTTERLKSYPEHYQKLLEYLLIARDKTQLQEEQITAENKRDHRALLQWLGGYLPKMVDEGIWFDEIIRRVAGLKDVDLATVGGVRYVADAERIKRAGGVIVEISRPAHDEQDRLDVTERERVMLKPDARVLNSASLAALQLCARGLYDDLQSGQLQPQYDARDYANA